MTTMNNQGMLIYYAWGLMNITRVWILRRQHIHKICRLVGQRESNWTCGNEYISTRLELRPEDLWPSNSPDHNTTWYWNDVILYQPARTEYRKKLNRYTKDVFKPTFQPLKLEAIAKDCKRSLTQSKRICSRIYIFLKSHCLPYTESSVQ